LDELGLDAGCELPFADRAAGKAPACFKAAANRPAVSNSAQDTRTLSVFMVKASDFGGGKKLGRKPILTSVFGLQRGGRWTGLSELNSQMSCHATASDH
jgi:hypothetical protein